MLMAVTPVGYSQRMKQRSAASVSHSVSVSHRYGDSCAARIDARAKAARKTEMDRRVMFRLRWFAGS
jgi:hypothetical protein